MQKRGWAFDYVTTLCDKARQESVILPEAREIGERIKLFALVQLKK